MLAPLRARLRERVARWARQRQGTDALPLVLHSRRLYILPTRAGLAFAVLLFVMLVAGLNYTNSLALLLTFVLGSCILVGMHECQRTLQGLWLLQAQAGDCYAGMAGCVELRFENRSRQARRALSIRVPGAAPTAFSLAAGAEIRVAAGFNAPRRGRQRIDRLELATTAPFGLFRCWTWLYLPLDALVYPQPLGHRPLPRAAAGPARRPSPGRSPGEDEWAGLRHYQTGDSLRAIAWKAVARGAPLMVAQYAGEDGSEHVLSFAGLEPLDPEARLSQLCAWIRECARRYAACALRLPGLELPLWRGAVHTTELLRALALYGEAP